MGSFFPDKLHVRFIEPCGSEGPESPRRYTLTHSDLTGDLFLTIGPEYDKRQISGIYTRLMRDEVLGGWDTDEPALHLFVHPDFRTLFHSISYFDPF
jgi:hypothetical protein